MEKFNKILISPLQSWNPENMVKTSPHVLIRSGGPALYSIFIASVLIDRYTIENVKFSFSMSIFHNNNLDLSNNDFSLRI